MGCDLMAKYIQIFIIIASLAFASVSANEQTAPNPALTEQSFIQTVIQELGLEPSSVKTDLVALKPNPEAPNEVIVVIPEIVDEGEHYFELNSHILIVDKQTSKITHRFFESSQTNQWFSDAIILREISIDTAPYYVKDSLRAFGVLVSYFGLSRVNPYELKALSLFTKSGENLSKILAHYPVKQVGGQWDGDCEGMITDTDKLLLITQQKTNGFYDLLVKSKITESKTAVNKSDDCSVTDTVTWQKTKLKFTDNRYQ
jgi:hypothetical protein